MSETSRRVLAPGYMRGESWADTVILAREVEVLESVPIGDFGVDPGDSAALLRLREAIDEHLPHYEPEHTDGDYDGVVRVAGRELTVTWEQETARLRERVRVLEDGLAKDGRAVVALCRRVLAAPCSWCGYSGPGYWQTGTHLPTCRWHAIGGEAERVKALEGGK